MYKGCQSEQVNNALTQHPLNAVNFFNARLMLSIKKKRKRNAHCLIYGRRWHL